MRIAGQLREEAGRCPDHVFLILKVRRAPQAHTRTKAPWRAKGEQCQGMLYPHAFAVEPILSKRRTHRHGRILRYTKYGLWARQTKMTDQRKIGRNE